MRALTQVRYPRKRLETEPPVTERGPLGTCTGGRNASGRVVNLPVPVFRDHPWLSAAFPSLPSFFFSPLSPSVTSAFSLLVLFCT